MRNISKLHSMTNNHIALLDLQYLPPADLVCKLNGYAELRMEQHDHYQKGSFRNRCCILGSNGVINLSVPLRKGKHQQQPMQEVRIANDTAWQRQHFRSLRAAYGSAPFWEHYADRLEPLFATEYDLLADWNMDLWHVLKKILKWDEVQLTRTENYEAVAATGITDFRGQFMPNNSHSPTLPYPQVFADRFGFVPHLSAIDALFCCGANYFTIDK